MEKYDQIGTGYNQTRKADPYLLERMRAHLQPVESTKHLDLGCGTGNYTIELAAAGGAFTGLDPSETMLEVARSRTVEVNWIQGKAEQLPFPSVYFDGILASLTIHHWATLTAGFHEMRRVLKACGKLVIFTSTPEQMAGYWLNHYFPLMMAASMQQMPAFETVHQALVENGFSKIQTEKYFIRKDLQDLFLYSGKHQPKLYLDEQIRKGISSFSNLARQDEIRNGLENLNRDITTGKVDEIIRKYENETGDYLFVVAQ